MKIKLIAAVFALMGASWAQDTDLIPSNQILDKINELAKKGRDTLPEQTKLIWVLALRSSQGEGGLYKEARPVAERLRSWDETNPRIRFSYGYFKTKEALGTLDPFLRKRRLDEGRRMCNESLSLGSKEPDFLFDAGLMLLSLGTDANMYSPAVNSLTLCKRIFGKSFADVPKPRQADWYAGMGIGLESVGLVELAREQYSQAAVVSPESPSGKKAIDWCRKHGPAG